jgi:hypothetical protein
MDNPRKTVFIADCLNELRKRARGTEVLGTLIA